MPLALLVGTAREEIAVLAPAGLFLAEGPTTRRLFADQARAGVRVPWLLGDPSSVPVAQCGEEEGIGSATVGAKIRHALANGNRMGTSVPSRPVIYLMKANGA